MRNNFGEGPVIFGDLDSHANADGEEGGHGSKDTLMSIASSSPNHFGEGHRRHESLMQRANADGDGGGHLATDHHLAVVSSSPNHFGEGHPPVDTQLIDANADGDEIGHPPCDSHTNPADPSPLTLSSEGPAWVENQCGNANTGSGEEVDQTHGDILPSHIGPSSLEITISTIRSRHRQRCFAMEQRKRSDLALGSFLRQQLGWSRSLPEAERNKIKKQALTLIDLGGKEAKALAKGKPFEIDEPAYLEWRELVLASVAARTPFEVIEKQATKEMERLAKTLPVWAWADSVRGFGAIGLATIIAETGDLSLYANPAKVWKRCGLAVMDGLRQGGLSKNAGAEAWIAHGYNRQRRSRIWTLGDSLLKPAGPYRDIYLARKQYRKERAEAEGLTVAPAAKIPKKRAAEFMSLMHIHRDAQRYMEKRLLKHLWQAWRQTTAQLHSEMKMSAADKHGRPIVS